MNEFVVVEIQIDFFLSQPFSLYFPFYSINGSELEMLTEPKRKATCCTNLVQPSVLLMMKSNPRDIKYCLQSKTS